MADEQMADESGWRAADHNARIVADQRDQIVKLGAELERLRAAIEGLRRQLADESEMARAAAWELERLRAALRDVVACSLIDEPTTDVMIDALDRAREVLGDE